MQTDGVVLDRVEQTCAEVVDRGETPSLSVAVVRGGQIEYARAWGRAATGCAATPQTAYLLASVTKPMTATAVLALAESGSLSLDVPVTTYLPQLRFTPRAGGAQPTIRHLLSHTSGLGLHLDFTYPGDDEPVPDLAETVRRYGNLFHAPGTRWAYSNLGYGILDAVVSRVGGAPFSDALREIVLAPLGMDSADCGPHYGGLVPHAVPSTMTGRAYAPYDTTHRGASMAWASAPDLARFGASLTARGGVLRAATREAMSAPALPGTSYGLGLVLGSAGDYRTIGHEGSMGGVATALLVVPDLDLSLAVLANRMGSTARTVRDRLLAELVPRAVVAAPDAGPVTVAAELHATRWSGRITTADGDVPVEVSVSSAGSVTARVGATAGWQEASLEPSYHIDRSCDLLARLPDPLPTAQARRRSPRTYLMLERSGRGLSGAVRAEPLPDDATGWFGDCYSYWCELEQVGGS